MGVPAHPPVTLCVSSPPPRSVPRGDTEGLWGTRGGGLWRDYGTEGASTLSITLCVSPISVPNSRVGLQRRHGGGRTEGTWGGYRGGMGEAGSASTPPHHPVSVSPPCPHVRHRIMEGLQGDTEGTWGGVTRGSGGARTPPPGVPRSRAGSQRGYGGTCRGCGGDKEGAQGCQCPPLTPCPPRCPQGWAGDVEGLQRDAGGGDTQRGHGVF